VSSPSSCLFAAVYSQLFISCLFAAVYSRSCLFAACVSKWRENHTQARVPTVWSGLSSSVFA